MDQGYDLGVYKTLARALEQENQQEELCRELEEAMRALNILGVEASCLLVSRILKKQ